MSLKGVLATEVFRCETQKALTTCAAWEHSLNATTHALLPVPFHADGKIQTFFTKIFTCVIKSRTRLPTIGII